MANKTPQMGATPLGSTDRVLYVELESGVYALATASVLVGMQAGEAELLSVDDAGALVVIPHVHHKVHQEEMFTASIFSLVNANGAIISMLLRTGSPLYGHLAFTTAAGGNAQVRLLENPAVTNPGNPLTEYNMKRYSAVPSPGASTPAAQIQAFGNPAYIEQTVLTNFLLAGGAGGNARGGVVRQRTEWVLRRNTDYIIELANLDAGNQPLSIVAQWYEVDTA